VRYYCTGGNGGLTVMRLPTGMNTPPCWGVRSISDEAPLIATPVSFSPGKGKGAKTADLGDQADVGVIGAMPRDEQNTGLLADVHGQRHVHAREDDGVLEGDQEKFRHIRSVPEIVDVGKYPLRRISWDSHE